jgi:hypothetical protein
MSCRDRHQRLLLAILATSEAEIRRIAFRGQGKQLARPMVINSWVRWYAPVIPSYMKGYDQEEDGFRTARAKSEAPSQWKSSAWWHAPVTPATMGRIK